LTVFFCIVIYCKVDDLFLAQKVSRGCEDGAVKSPYASPEDFLCRKSRIVTSSTISADHHFPLPSQIQISQQCSHEQSSVPRTTSLEPPSIISLPGMSTHPRVPVQFHFIRSTGSNSRGHHFRHTADFLAFSFDTAEYCAIGIYWAYFAVL